MTTVLVWLLVSVGGYNSNVPVVVERFATSEECVRVSKALPRSEAMYLRCIQANIVVLK